MRGLRLHLLELREKKNEKIVLSSLSQAGLAQKVLSGDATGKSATALLPFQKAGTMEGSGGWGRMDTCICMIGSFCCALETIRTLLISYTPIRSKKFK